MSPFEPEGSRLPALWPQLLGFGLLFARRLTEARGGRRPAVLPGRLGAPALAARGAGSALACAGGGAAGFFTTGDCDVAGLEGGVGAGLGAATMAAAGAATGLGAASTGSALITSA